VERIDGDSKECGYTEGSVAATAVPASPQPQIPWVRGREQPSSERDTALVDIRLGLRVAGAHMVVDAAGAAASLRSD